MEALVTFLQWLDSQTKASRLEACEITLARFRDKADRDPDFAGEVGIAVWGLLSTSPGEDASSVLAEMRSRAQALGRQCLEDLSSRLLDAGCHDETRSEARTLVAFWFRAVALCAGPTPQTTSALHIAAKYERAFAALGRSMQRIATQRDAEGRRAAA
jgi:hypothetical protein